MSVGKSWVESEIRDVRNIRNTLLAIEGSMNVNRRSRAGWKKSRGLIIVPR